MGLRSRPAGVRVAAEAAVEAALLDWDMELDQKVVAAEGGS